jgi:hypothetical protein
VVLNDGALLMAGGNLRSQNVYSNVTRGELLDFRKAAPFSDTVGSLSAPGRWGHALVKLPNGKVLVAGGAYIVNQSTNSGQNTAETYDPSSGLFTATRGNMTAQRALGPLAALLPDGRVLLAAGYSYESATDTATAETYDQGSDTFTAVPGGLVSARDGHQTLLLPNGRVLIAGGNSATAEVFDPQDYTPHTWSSTPPSAPSLATSRSANTATQIGDGRVLIAGGRDASGSLVTATELFDPFFHASSTPPVGATLASGPNLTTPRTNHTATRLYDGGVLIAGGLDSTGAPLGAELYSFTYYQLGSIAPTATAMPPRSSHAAVALPDGRVLIAGGIDASGNVLNTAVLYCPAADLLSGSCTVTGKFDPAGNTMSTARAGHTMTLLGDGRVMIAGGSTTASGFAPNPSGATSTVEFFDWKTSKFVSSAATLSTARLFHTATLDPLGAVVFTGGTGASGSVLASTERYDENTDAFDGASPPLSPARSGHQAVLLPWGQVLIAGGVDGSGTPLNSTQFLDFYDHTTTLALGIAPASRAFATVGAMSTARAGFSLVLLGNGRVLAVGGTDGAKPVGGLEWFK